MCLQSKACEVSNKVNAGVSAVRQLAALSGNSALCGKGWNDSHKFEWDGAQARNQFGRNMAA